MADLTMLRKELVIGYAIAGFLAVLVPTHVWNVVFIHGHGFWTSLENVIVGPLIAVVSFVCSIGNVPLAAALWKGGISFGGVISFIFADLISFPLLLIYRKYYGTKLTLRILATFWAVMAAGGLIVEGLFAGLGLVPHHRSTRIVETSFHWNYTTFLNIAFLVVFVGLYWLYRNRDRLGGGQGYGIDPVCGMQVRTANAPAHSSYQGRPIWFCSDHCAERFAAAPARYATNVAAGGGVPDSRHGQPGEEERGLVGDQVETITPGGHRDAVDPATPDPVCGMSVEPTTAAGERRYAGGVVWFCSERCLAAFDADPARYQAVAEVDPVCGMTVNTAAAAVHRSHDDTEIFFCSLGCADRFDADPGRYIDLRPQPRT